MTGKVIIQIEGKTYEEEFTHLISCQDLLTRFFRLNKDLRQDAERAIKMIKDTDDLNKPLSLQLEEAINKEHYRHAQQLKAQIEMRKEIAIVAPEEDLKRIKVNTHEFVNNDLKTSDKGFLIFTDSKSTNVHLLLKDIDKQGIKEMIYKAMQQEKTFRKAVIEASSDFVLYGDSTV